MTVFVFETSVKADANGQARTWEEVPGTQTGTVPFESSGEGVEETACSSALDPTPGRSAFNHLVTDRRISR